MHDPGGDLLFASLRNSGQRFSRAVTYTLMFEPGYPSSFITQSSAFIRRTTAWSGRRRADPTSDAGDGSKEEEAPRCIRAEYLARSDVGAVAHRPVEEPRRSICLRTRPFRHRVLPDDSPGTLRKGSGRSRTGNIGTKQGPVDSLAVQSAVASDPNAFTLGSISNRRRHAPRRVSRGGGLAGS